MVKWNVFSSTNYQWTPPLKFRMDFFRTLILHSIYSRTPFIPLYLSLLSVKEVNYTLSPSGSTVLKVALPPVEVHENYYGIGMTQHT
jgi:hypothetical protein